MDSPEIDCNCNNQTLQRIDSVEYSVCDVCGMCWTEEGDGVGYIDEILNRRHRGVDNA